MSWRGFIATDRWARDEREMLCMHECSCTDRCYVSDDCVYSVTSNDNISIVSDKFWDKIIRAIFSRTFLRLVSSATPALLTKLGYLNYNTEPQNISYIAIEHEAKLSIHQKDEPLKRALVCSGNWHVLLSFKWSYPFPLQDVRDCLKIIHHWQKM